jgi:hypothetical protein
MKKTVAFVALAATLATSTACDSFGQAMTSHQDVLARASGHELSVDKAASLFGLNPRIPPQPDVVNAIANLWIDYTLLATAVSKDSTLNAVNLDPIIEPYIEQEVVWRLREKVIKVDTALSDAQLKAMLEKEGTGLQVKARHVLLRLPADATPAQRDSVNKLAQDIKKRAQAGEDFGALARRYSQEPGADKSGGDLGFFGKGQMVAPFEEVAFKMQPGQVSDPVETPFGIHIIKVEDRKMASFDELKTNFRQQMKERMVQDAEQNYVKTLTDTMNLEVEPGAYETVKEIAKNSELDISRRAARRALLKYKGGETTAGEFSRFLQRLQPQQRQMLTTQTDENLKQLLEGMARNEILVAEAKRQKLEVPAKQVDSVRNEIRKQLRSAITEAQLNNIKPQEGESMDQAIDRRVWALLEGNIKGDRSVIPLGPISYSLREQYKAQIFEQGVTATVQKAEQMRAQSAPGQGVVPQGAPAPGQQQKPAPAPPPAANKPKP